MQLCYKVLATHATRKVAEQRGWSPIAPLGLRLYYTRGVVTEAPIGGLFAFTSLSAAERALALQFAPAALWLAVGFESLPLPKRLADNWDLMCVPMEDQRHYARLAWEGKLAAQKYWIPPAKHTVAYKRLALIKPLAFRNVPLP